MPSITWKCFQNIIVFTLLFIIAVIIGTIYCPAKCIIATSMFYLQSLSVAGELLTRICCDLSADVIRWEWIILIIRSSDKTSRQTNLQTVTWDVERMNPHLRKCSCKEKIPGSVCVLCRSFTWQRKKLRHLIWFLSTWNRSDFWHMSAFSMLLFPITFLIKSVVFSLLSIFYPIELKHEFEQLYNCFFFFGLHKFSSSFCV